jgi:hypothetical protein
MSAMQLAYTASAIGVDKATLIGYGEGRTMLPADCLAKLAQRLYQGAYLVKREERAS